MNKSCVNLPKGFSGASSRRGEVCLCRPSPKKGFGGEGNGDQGKIAETTEHRPGRLERHAALSFA